MIVYRKWMHKTQTGRYLYRDGYFLFGFIPLYIHMDNIYK
jgi:hypothetical protein